MSVREIIVINRTMVDLGLRETAFKVSTSLETIEQAYGKSNALSRFFSDEAKRPKTCIILFYLEKGPLLKRRQIVIDLKSNRSRRRIDYLYASIGARNPHRYLGDMKRITEAEFICRNEMGIRMGDAVLEKMRKP